MFTTAKEIIEQIEQRKNRGYGLDHFKGYMETLGNPHKKLKAIHIAGTNGKGSTTNYIRSILQAAGYQVGSFTSPYMITHLDRIRINDHNIPTEDFIAITNEHYEEWMAWDLSMFEIDMCIAVLYFLQKRVDYAVFEVGLGGRKDSTNILEPLVSVITNIGLDHMDLLGDTHELIAAEKAGIIKDGIALITAEEKPECLRVFRSFCEKHNTMMIQVKPVTTWHSDTTITFSYGTLDNLQLQTMAFYQIKNAGLAIEVSEYLRTHYDIALPDTAIRQGLYEAQWLGRFEVIRKDPLLILDGAHNAHGIRALCESLSGYDDPIIIFSVLKDKNFEEMLDILETISTHIFITPFANERAMDIHKIKHRANITLMDNYRQALEEADKYHKTTIITGSLYFISEVRNYLVGDSYE